MVSPGELSPTPAESPFSAEVIERTNRIAEEVAKREVAELRKQLTELIELNPSLILHTQIIPSEEIKRQRVISEVVGKREDGLMNDSRSRKPGIFVTGLVDYRAIEQMRQDFGTYNVEHELTTWRTGSVEVPYALHLPQGAFKNIVEGEFIDIPDKYLGDQYYLQVLSAVKFSEDGSDFQAVAGGDAHLLTGGYLGGGNTNVYGTIGRIEGAGGVLWQNPNTYPDGSPRVLGNYSAGDVLEQGS